jgi:hypothetical protein
VAGSMGSTQLSSFQESITGDRAPTRHIFYSTFPGPTNSHITGQTSTETMELPHDMRLQNDQITQVPPPTPPQELPCPSTPTLIESVPNDVGPPQPTANNKSRPWDNIKALLPKPKAQWPNPEASIGRPCCPLGGNKCWEVIGPARDLSYSIQQRVKDLLESCNEYLNEGEPVPRLMMYGVYMVGKNEKDAMPTLIFSCESRTSRRKAVKLIKESPILNEFLGVRLATSSQPPISFQPLELMALDGEPRPVSLADGGPIGVLVSRSHQAGNACGIPISINRQTRLNMANTRDATIGGILQTGNCFYGLTVAHPFFRTENAESPTKDSFEFAFEDLSGSDDGGSPHEPGSKATALECTDYNDVEKLGVFAYAREKFGMDLDWALVEIELLSFKAANVISFEIEKNIHYRYPLRINPGGPADCDVLIATGSKGVVKGHMSGTPYFLKMPLGQVFHEVWHVQLQDIIGRH